MYVMGQNPTLMPTQNVRLGGNGATSTFRAMAWLPKLLTSGSNPWYFVQVIRLRPSTLIVADRTPRPRSETTLVGRSYDKVSSRSLMNDASWTYWLVFCSQLVIR